MARAALKLSVDQVGNIAGVSAETIRRLERCSSPKTKLTSIEKLQTAYESLGVIFLRPLPGQAAGVRYGEIPSET